ncbi:MAG: hypothetical protein U5O39_03650 [Gammaproteobacteria bacterium]|nr:hypothetical protein [Gammaproteobacteria bacterium]
MRLRIIHSRSKGAGKEARESLYDGDRATIGRGTDQAIQLPGRIMPLHHSRLAVRDGCLTLTAATGHSFSINDRPTRYSVLEAGDEIYIGSHKLAVGAGDDDVDFVVEVEVGEEEEQSLRDRFTTRLWQLGMPERSLSWALFAAILGIGLIVPAAGFLVGHEPIRKLPLPDDSMWATGDLHQTHAFMGDRCEYCHTEPFERAREEDCLYCHLSVNHHFDTDRLGRDYHIGDRCGDCHREHSESGSIVRSDQEVCTVCHADLPGAGYASSDLEPATDFMDDHPPFKVAVTSWNASAGEFEHDRLYPWSEELKKCRISSSRMMFT